MLKPPLASLVTLAVPMVTCASATGCPSKVRSVPVTVEELEHPKELSSRTTPMKQGPCILESSTDSLASGCCSTFGFLQNGVMFVPPPGEGLWQLGAIL